MPIIPRRLTNLKIIFDDFADIASIAAVITVVKIRPLSWNLLKPTAKYNMLI